MAPQIHKRKLNADTRPESPHGDSSALAHQGSRLLAVVWAPATITHALLSQEGISSPTNSRVPSVRLSRLDLASSHAFQPCPGCVSFPTSALTRPWQQIRIRTLDLVLFCPWMYRSQFSQKKATQYRPSPERVVWRPELTARGQTALSPSGCPPQHPRQLQDPHGPRRQPSTSPAHCPPYGEARGRGIGGFVLALPRCSVLVSWCILSPNRATKTSRRRPPRWLTRSPTPPWTSTPPREPSTSSSLASERRGPSAPTSSASISRPLVSPRQRQLAFSSTRYSPGKSKTK